MSIIRAYTSAVVKAYIRAVIPGYDGEPRISLNTGQFIVTGNDALLQYGFIPLGKGEYLMTGNSMSLLAGRLLALGKGEIVLTGNDSTLTYTPNETNEAEVTAYITGLSTELSAAQITRLNTFVSALKTGLSITNLSDSFDVMYILGGETSESSLKNLVKDAHHATAVNSPTFTQYEGFAGNGTSSYINTNYKVYTDMVRYADADASFGVYSRTNSAGSKFTGTRSASNNKELTLNIRNTMNDAEAAVNSNLVAGTNDSMTSSLGLITLTRTDNAKFYIYQNKTQRYENTIASEGVTDNYLYIGALNQAGSAIVYDDRQFSFAFVGKGLTETAIGVLFDALEAYMDANSKGVVS